MSDTNGVFLLHQTLLEFTLGRDGAKSETIGTSLSNGLLDNIR